MKIRCRNCGLWHDTKNCPNYGPWYPAPGKTRADYADAEKRIADRVAADIMAEHDNTEVDEGEVIVNRRKRKAKIEPAQP